MYEEMSSSSDDERSNRRKNKKNINKIKVNERPLWTDSCTFILSINKF